MSSRNFELETRESWGADPARSKHTLFLPVIYVFCAMHTQTEACTDTDHCRSLVREMQFEHAQMDKLPDIKYNFLIGGDAKVYEGRGWHLAPTLPDRYSSLSNKSLYFAFIGNMKGGGPAKELLTVRDELVKYGFKRGYIDFTFTEFLMLSDEFAAKE